SRPGPRSASAAGIRPRPARTAPAGRSAPFATKSSLSIFWVGLARDATACQAPPSSVPAARAAVSELEGGAELGVDVEREVGQTELAVHLHQDAQGPHVIEEAAAGPDQEGAALERVDAGRASVALAELNGVPDVAAAD